MERKNIYKALANFQQEVPVLLKDTDGYGYKYVKLEHIIAQIKPVLKKHHLGFTQFVEQDGLRTTLFHTTTGESIDAWCHIPECDMKGMNKFQSAGAGITYFRRYALSSMLGVITDADTDAKVYTSTPLKSPKTKLDTLKKSFDLEEVKITNLKTGKTKVKLEVNTKEFDNAVKHIKKNPDKSLSLLMKDIEKHYIVDAKMKKELSKLLA
jgi:hypothetical protein|tara:strand:- start:14505 stop:15134 length:630 start_codon:yes stop_codon:yes gene_type:complete